MISVYYTNRLTLSQHLEKNMHQKLFAIPLSIVILSISLFSTLHAAPSASSDPGYKAFMQAAKANKFLMVHLYSGKQDQKLVKACGDALGVLKKSLNTINIDLNNTGTGFLVEKYNLKYAPLPLVIIIAPNGIISGSFQSPFSPDQVKSAFQTPKTLKCLLALQERKLVFVSAQGKVTSENKEALDGIRRFEKENPLYGSVEMILIDPKDSSEAPFLSKLQVQPDIKKAQTFLLVPPGRIMGRWDGATDPGEFVKRLNSMSKSCSAPSCADPTCK
jgi:hypothetical protein